MGLADSIRALGLLGYTKDFNLLNTRLDRETGKLLSDEEFVIDLVLRFDVMSDPDDQSVLYAIHSKKTGIKGVLVNGFGIYSETQANQIADTLLRKKCKV